MLCLSLNLQNIKEIEQALKGVEMAEIRLENTNLSDNDIINLFSNNENLIATCRPTANVSENDRKSKLITAIQNGAMWVDVELESSDNFIQEIQQEAENSGVKLIMSYHNYEKTPSYNELLSIIEKIKHYNPNLIKIACKVNNIKDNANILSLYKAHYPILAIGMGHLGKITRVVALKMGAPFTFVKKQYTEETAEGQLTYTQMKQILAYL